MSRPYYQLKGEQRKIADEAYRAIVRELKLQGATTVPFDDRAERLVDAIVDYMGGCEFQ